MAGIEQLLQQLLGGNSSAGGLDLAKLAALAGPLLQQLQGSGGLQGLLNQLQSQGLGEQANSWLGTGANEPVDPQALANALGEDKVDALAQQSGMSPQEVTNGLSAILPGLVDKMSPNGQLPTNPADLTSMLNQIPGGDQLGSMLGGLLGGNK